MKLYYSMLYMQYLSVLHIYRKLLGYRARHFSFNLLNFSFVLDTYTRSHMSLYES